MSSDPLWKHFSPNTAVTFPPPLRQKIRQNIILINFCLTDQSATDSHPLGTLACTDTLLTEKGPRALNCFHAALAACLAEREESCAPVPGPQPYRELPPAPTLTPSCLAGRRGKLTIRLDANERQREVRKHLSSSPFPPSPPLLDLRQITVKTKAHLWLLSRLCPSSSGSSLSLL